MKDSLIEIKNLQGHHSRVDEARNQINDLEHKEAKNKHIVSSLWDNFKCSNIIGVPEGEVKEQEIGNAFEKLMKENAPNLVKEIDMQV